MKKVHVLSTVTVLAALAAGCSGGEAGDAKPGGVSGYVEGLAAAIRGTNLEFTAALGALNISVKNGTATLDSDGIANSDGGDQDAFFAVGLLDNYGDRRHYLRHKLLSTEKI